MKSKTFVEPKWLAAIFFGLIFFIGCGCMFVLMMIAIIFYSDELGFGGLLAGIFCLIDILFKLIHRHRSEIVEALDDIAGSLLEILNLAGIVDTFCNGTNMHLSSHLENGFDDITVSSVIVFAEEKASIQFDRINIQFSQKIQRNCGFTEIVQRTAEAPGTNLADCVADLLRVFMEMRFRNLKFDLLMSDSIGLTEF